MERAALGNLAGCQVSSCSVAEIGREIKGGSWWISS